MIREDGHRTLNSGQDQSIKIASESFENVAKFKYLGTKLTNKNDIYDEIKSRLNSGNACYLSVQNLLSSRLISRKLKIKIHKIVILPVLLCGCDAWLLTSREEHRLKVLENSVLKRIFGHKGRKTDRGETCIMMNCIACILHLILLV
jgi:hypothetical protein